MSAEYDRDAELARLRPDILARIAVVRAAVRESFQKTEELLAAGSTAVRTLRRHELWRKIMTKFADAVERYVTTDGEPNREFWYEPVFDTEENGDLFFQNQDAENLAGCLCCGRPWNAGGILRFFTKLHLTPRTRFALPIIRR